MSQKRQGVGPPVGGRGDEAAVWGHEPAATGHAQLVQIDQNLAEQTQNVEEVLQGVQVSPSCYMLCRIVLTCSPQCLLPH